MQSEFVKAICQMGVFVICAQAIVHFRPKASYEKYIKVLVSSMILIQMFLSVGSIFTSEGEKTLAERTKWFMENLDLSFFSEDELKFQITGTIPGRFLDTEKTEIEAIKEIKIQIEPITPIRVD